MKSVYEAWKLIEQWLENNAPKIIKNLNPGATEQEIVETERVLDVAMPQEWRDLYSAHNGMNTEDNMGSLFFGMNFISLDRIKEELETSDETRDVKDAVQLKVRTANSGICTEDIYNRKWIPMAHDFGDTFLRIDLDPGEGGRNGQVIFTDHADDTAILLAPSITEFLWQFVSDLEKGNYALSKEALEAGDQFLQCASEIDVINWANSPRWKHLSPYN